MVQRNERASFDLQRSECLQVILWHRPIKRYLLIDSKHPVVHPIPAYTSSYQLDICGQGCG